MKKNKNVMLWLMIFILTVSAATTSLIWFSHNLLFVQGATYSWGSRGETVRTIQQKLLNWGYFTGPVDGVYGEQTYNAVRRFQSTNNLMADGIAGNATLEAMGIFEGSSSGGGAGMTPSNPLLPEDISDDVYLLASAIHGESRGEPYEGQVAVGAVILNRVESAQFPNSIPGVIYQQGAFDAVSDGQINLVPNDAAINAALDALNGWDPTEGALYYWNPSTATSRWIWSIPITYRVGRHVFGKK